MFVKVDHVHAVARVPLLPLLTCSMIGNFPVYVEAVLAAGDLVPAHFFREFHQRLRLLHLSPRTGIFCVDESARVDLGQRLRHVFPIGISTEVRSPSLSPCHRLSIRHARPVLWHLCNSGRNIANAWVFLFFSDIISHMIPVHASVHSGRFFILFTCPFGLLRCTMSTQIHLSRMISSFLSTFGFRSVRELVHDPLSARVVMRLLSGSRSCLSAPFGMVCLSKLHDVSVLTWERHCVRLLCVLWVGRLSRDLK